MKVLYFAWIREKTGKSEDNFELPDNVSTVDGLISWLSDQGDLYRLAFEDKSKIRAAVNQTFVPLGAKIKKTDEVALFPPVTGG